MSDSTRRTVRQSMWGGALLFLLLASPCLANPFIDFFGYSYLNGPPNTIGTTVAVPTRANDPQPDPIWPLDFNLNEYTIMADGLVISNVQFAGPVIYVTYSGGTIGFYADPSKNSDWGVNPPNGSVPGSFVDGEVLLQGHFTSLVMIFSTVTGTGTISGLFDWTGGSLFNQVTNPTGWTYFGGVSNHSDLGIPAGYDLAWDPQFYGPEPSVPVQTGSWGRIKQLYR